jgi:hypothetical protein
MAFARRWFGPQILLELSLAFYLPSIPVLFLLGQVNLLVLHLLTFRHIPKAGAEAAYLNLTEHRLRSS